MGSLVNTSFAARLLRPLALIVLASLATLPAAARELDVSVAPDRATWQDTLEVTVSSIVGTSCGPDIVHLEVVGRSFTSELGSHILLELRHDQCAILAPPSPHPFSVTAQVPLALLGPGVVVGEQTLVVRDVPEGGEVVVPVVIHDVSELDLLLPEAARSDAPAIVRLRGVAPCPQAEASVVDGVVEIVYNGDCPILPPGEVVFDLEVPVGPLPAGVYPVHVLDTSDVTPAFVPAVVKGTLRVWDAAGCVPSATELCLQEGRFRVEAAWRDFQGKTGTGQAIPLPVRDDSGLFWFFHTANLEITVKVLNGCKINDHYWAFVSGGSNVEYELTVTDTATGEQRIYRNELGEIPELLADTAAFAACP